MSTVFSFHFTCRRMLCLPSNGNRELATLIWPSSGRRHCAYYDLRTAPLLKVLFTTIIHHHLHQTVKEHHPSSIHLKIAPATPTLRQVRIHHAHHPPIPPPHLLPPEPPHSHRRHAQHRLRRCDAWLAAAPGLVRGVMAKGACSLSGGTRAGGGMFGASVDDFGAGIGGRGFFGGGDGVPAGIGASRLGSTGILGGSLVGSSEGAVVAGPGPFGMLAFFSPAPERRCLGSSFVPEAESGPTDPIVMTRRHSIVQGRGVTSKGTSAAVAVQQTGRRTRRTVRRDRVPGK